MEERPRPKGRSRGRARGAALPAENVGIKAAQPRGGSAPPTESGEGMLPSGRGVKRGSYHSRAAGVKEISTGVSRMSVSREMGGGDPHTRPEHVKSKKGEGGKQVQLTTNFFRLVCKRDWCLYQYRVDYDPEVDHIGARKGMLRDHTNLIGELYLFDGTMLFTTARLPSKETVVQSQRKTDNSVVNIKIQLTNELPPNSHACVQIYNILFRRVLGLLGMKQVARNYFDPSAAFTVDTNRCTFELWPGFVTSILNYENNVMLCAEVSHKLMRKDTVLDVFNNLINQCRNNPNRDFRRVCTDFMVGQIVLTRYNNKTYRIDEIAWDLNVSMKFKKGEEDITYLDYFKQQYGLDILDRNQPLLISRPKKREVRKSGLTVIHLVPELCTVTGLTDEIRSDFQTMKKLAEHTKQGPTARVKALTTFIQRIDKKPEVQDYLSKWGIKFETKLLEFGARVLGPEKIFFGGNRGVDAGPEANWDRAFRNNRLLRCVPLRDWYLIHLGRDAQSAKDLVQKMCQVSSGMGFDMARPTLIVAQSDRTQLYQKTITDLLNENPNTQLICCLLGSSRKDCYDAIKTVCCVDKPVPSQVVLKKTITNPKRVMSVATKIAIQINCKLGGEAWGVNIPLKGCMIIGIDTYHDSAQQGRSVGGFIASINSDYTRWYSNTTFQQSGVELSDGLKRCMTGALKVFRELNQKLPDRIMVYRDGVGDGQLDHIHGYEVEQLTSCFQNIPGIPNYNPKFTFVVVKKRINARFFANDRRGLTNPPPGTIIDDAVTRPLWYDFFVVSQTVREGTVSPTHFNVIRDSSGLSPDRMQRLSYKLCHLYYNWPGTIRVPAPCLYAHKLAFLVGQSIHKPPSPTLNDKLYFL